MQTISLFKGIYSEIEFKTFLSSDVPQPIKLDPEQMKRVFINLIDNAIEAMDKRGEISISTAFDPKTNSVRIEIADTGPGVPDKDKDKLFMPHFSTKKKGTGLGLAIVHQIISEHNGTIEVEDNHPHGAKFIIQVPV
jgi:two-component system nitrogen regulation sensor histidine kinase NtrY